MDSFNIFQKQMPFILEFLEFLKNLLDMILKPNDKDLNTTTLSSKEIEKELMA
jgi:hypothetical protein